MSHDDFKGVFKKREANKCLVHIFGNCNCLLPYRLDIYREKSILGLMVRCKWNKNIKLYIFVRFKLQTFAKYILRVN